MKFIKSIFTLLFLFCWMSTSSIAQSETTLAREGNDLFVKGQHVDAELKYKKSLRANEENDLDAAVYNLGNALFEQQRFDEAVEQYNHVVSTIKDKETRADAFHNLGNIYMMQQNLEEAIEMFKSSLRLDPNDDESRYNLAYAKELLKNESKEEKEERKKQCDNPKDSDEQNQEKKEEQEKKDQEKKDEEQKDEEEKEQEEQEKEEQEKKDEEKKDEEQKDEQQKDQEQQEKEEQEKKEQEQQEKEEGEEKEEESQPKPEEGENDEEKQDSLQQAQDQQADSLGVPPQQMQLSKEEILRMLEAMKNEEMKVQEKLRGAKAKKGNTRKSDKDW